MKFELTTSKDSGENLSVGKTWNENEDYTDYHTKLDGQGSCTFEGNSKFNQRQWGDWNACNNTAVINGHNWFPENTSVNGVNLTVDKNLCADGDFTMERNANIIVENNARIEGHSILKSTSTVEINNLYANSDFTFKKVRDFIHVEEQELVALY